MNQQKNKQAMIEVTNISKSLPDGRKLLDGISFTVRRGEFVGILGASGAGKTLTLRCLNGLLKPDTGSVVVQDQDGSKWDICTIAKTRLKQLRRRIGIVFQGYHLVQRLTALDNVLLGRLGQISTLRSLFYGFTDKERAVALHALEKVNIGSLAGARVGRLSGGEMQRVAIARAIFQNPGLLLADEPSASLDDGHTSQMLALLLDTAEREGCTLVIASHDGRVIDAMKQGEQRDNVTEVVL